MSVTDRATRGLAWVTGAALVTKVVSTFGQIALAWFLLPEDFGAVAMAYSVMAFVNVLQQAGSAEVLLSRPKRFERWSSLALWMNLVIGVGAMAVVAGLAPLAARAFDAPVVAPLLLVLALATPLSAVTAVPTAKLRLALRFRAIALTQFLLALSRTGMAIGLAAADFGPYSFVLPVPVTQAMLLVLLWRLARPRVDRRLQLRRWRYLLGDSVMLVASRGLNTVLWQVDYMILGLFHPKAVVGLYFFGFNLSIQTLRLFAGNFAQVMLPALANVKGGPARQTAEFIKAIRLLAVVALPLSVLQALLADPLVRLVFDERWYSAIGILQALSIGMAFRLVGSPAGTLMQAHRRYRTILAVNAVYAALFIATIALAAWLGDGLTVAIAAAAFFAVLGPAHLIIAVQGRGGSWRDIASLFGAATGVVTLPAAVGLALTYFIDAQAWPDYLFEAATCSFVFGVCYLLALRVGLPADFQQITRRVRGLLRK